MDKSEDVRRADRLRRGPASEAEEEREERRERTALPPASGRQRILSRAWHLEFAHAAGRAASRFLVGLRDDGPCGRRPAPSAPDARAAPEFLRGLLRPHQRRLGRRRARRGGGVVHVHLRPLRRLRRPALRGGLCPPRRCATAIANFVTGVDFTDPAAAAARLAIGTRMRAVFRPERQARITDFHFEREPGPEVSPRRSIHGGRPSNSTCPGASTTSTSPGRRRSRSSAPARSSPPASSSGTSTVSSTPTSSGRSAELGAFGLRVPRPYGGAGAGPAQHVHRRRGVLRARSVAGGHRPRAGHRRLPVPSPRLRGPPGRVPARHGGGRDLLRLRPDRADRRLRRRQHRHPGQTGPAVGWVISGAKQFITNSGTPFSKYVILFAATRPADTVGTPPPGGPRPPAMSAFLVPLDAPGVTVGPQVSQAGLARLRHPPAVLRGRAGARLGPPRPGGTGLPGGAGASSPGPGCPSPPCRSAWPRAAWRRRWSSPTRGSRSASR